MRSLVQSEKIFLLLPAGKDVRKLFVLNQFAVAYDHTGEVAASLCEIIKKVPAAEFVMVICDVLPFVKAFPSEPVVKIII